MKKNWILLIIIYLILPLHVAAEAPHQDPVTVLPETDSNLVRLGEGTLFCYAGYGTQQLIINVEGTSAHSDKGISPYLPNFDPLSTTFLRFGCKNDLFFMDFSSVDDSMRLNREVTYNGSTHNSVRFEYRVVAVGHSLSLIPHRLYLDLGLGYAVFDYHLGFDSSQTTEALSSVGLLFRTAFRVVINHYVMIHWQHDKSIDDKNVVDYDGQLGLNFISRF